MDKPHLIITSNSNKNKWSKQFDKKTASPLYMDGSIVFARWRQCAPHLTHASMGHPGPYPKWHLNRFSDCCTAHSRESLYFTMGRLFPLKIAHLHGGSEPSFNTWFLEPTRVHNPNSISIGSAIFAGLMIMTDRPTDRWRYFVCNNRPHLRSTVMRPNNDNDNHYFNKPTTIH